MTHTKPFVSLPFFCKLPLSLKLTNTKPFAVRFVVTGDTTPDGITSCTKPRGIFRKSLLTKRTRAESVYSRWKSEHEALRSPLGVRREGPGGLEGEAHGEAFPTEMGVCGSSTMNSLPIVAPAWSRRNLVPPVKGAPLSTWCLPSQVPPSAAATATATCTSFAA